MFLGGQVGDKIVRESLKIARFHGPFMSLLSKTEAKNSDSFVVALLHPLQYFGQPLLSNVSRAAQPATQGVGSEG